jgi:hypothetical protein
LNLAKRSAISFEITEEMQKRSAGPIGDALREQFSARDILESSHEPTLLAFRPGLAAEKT